jgi:uncharacterized protein (DUF302 family)
MTIQNRPFAGVRVVADTSVTFDDVLQRLRVQMGRVNVSDVVGLARNVATEADYVREVTKRYVGESGFMLFAEIDHGGWLPIFGIRRRTVRWILGNPLIAVTMIRHDITAGLFAPVELLISEHQDGEGTNIVYLRPSSVMVTERNEPLRVAAEALDVKLDALVAHAVA